jgi:hypothetical protein
MMKWSMSFRRLGGAAKARDPVPSATIAAPADPAKNVSRDSVLMAATFFAFVHAGAREHRRARV